MGRFYRRELQRQTRHEQLLALTDRCERLSEVRGAAYRSPSGRVFLVAPGVARTLRRVYGEISKCETCEAQFVRRRKLERFCTTRCSKIGERNPMRIDQRRRKSLARNTADKWFSIIIRAAGRCERCRATEHLQCAHVFSRGYVATRWNESNAMCLCRGCHTYFTHRPIEWEDFAARVMGRETYQALRLLAVSHERPDMEALLDYLAARFDAVPKN